MRSQRGLHFSWIVTCAALSSACGNGTPASSGPPIAKDASSPQDAYVEASVVVDAGVDAPTDAYVQDASICTSLAPSVDDWTLHTEGTRIMDAHGRIVLLRGVNAGGRSKFAPYVPFDFTDATFDSALASYFDRAASWGIDLVRVPFVWQAIEGTMGTDDATYLAHLDALIDAAWARRIWVILDFHQDVYAEPFCGDGFPLWTLPDPDVAPLTNCSNWSLEYALNSDVTSAFDAFWSDSAGTQTAYGSLVDRLVARYHDRPGILGFEPFNEPGWGTALLPQWEQTTFPAFITKTATRVHQTAPSWLVFFDLPGIDGITVSTSLTLPSGTGLVFAPHYYQASGADPSSVNAAITKWANMGSTWGVPTWLGEFGTGAEETNASAYIKAHFDAFDSLQISATQWEYSVSSEVWNDETFSLTDGDGNENASLVDPLVRVYPRTIAGAAPAFTWDPSSRHFHLSYSPIIGGTSEIEIPPRIYGDSMNVNVVGGCVDHARTDGVLAIVATGTTDVIVDIAPR